MSHSSNASFVAAPPKTWGRVVVVVDVLVVVELVVDVLVLVVVVVVVCVVVEVVVVVTVIVVLVVVRVVLVVVVCVCVYVCVCMCVYVSEFILMYVSGKTRVRVRRVLCSDRKRFSLLRCGTDNLSVFRCKNVDLSVQMGNG